MRQVVSLQQLCQDLKIEYIPHSFTHVYDEGVQLYKDGFPFLNRAYFQAFNAKYQLFQKYTDLIQEAGEALEKNERLLLFVCILSKALLKFTTYELIRDLSLPTTEDPEELLAYRFAPLFALLPSVERTVQRFRDRNVPESVIADTLKQYEGCIDTVKKRWGYLGYNGIYFNWMTLTVNNAIMTVGRLQYEIRDFSGLLSAFRNKEGETVLLADQIRVNKDGVGIHYEKIADNKEAMHCQIQETEEYYMGNVISPEGFVTTEVRMLPKAQWEKVLSHGDLSISIHIPASGKLTDALCMESYREAKRIFAECFPDMAFKTYFCHSWLMDPQLRAMLKPDSNILKFMSRYSLYPYEASENDDVFAFVFTDPFKTYADLPETTSLMRSIKQHYLSGKSIYVCGGILETDY